MKRNENAWKNHGNMAFNRTKCVNDNSLKQLINWFQNSKHYKILPKQSKQKRKSGFDSWQTVSHNFWCCIFLHFFFFGLQEMNRSHYLLVCLMWNSQLLVSGETCWHTTQNSNPGVWLNLIFIKADLFNSELSNPSFVQWCQLQAENSLILSSWLYCPFDHTGQTCWWPFWQGFCLQCSQHNHITISSDFLLPF